MDFIFDASLVLYLPLAELDGNPFASKDGFAHLCYTGGAVWSPEGRLFTGANDKLTVPHHPALELTAGLTFEVWAKAVSLASTSDNLLYKGNYGCGVANNGRIRLYLNTGFGISAYNSEPDEMLTGVWYHLAMTYDGTRWYIFKNGRDIKSGVLAGSVQLSANDLKIGEESAPNYIWHGYIGDVRIYNRALSSPEIAQNYLATKGRYQ